MDQEVSTEHGAEERFASPGALFKVRLLPVFFAVRETVGSGGGGVAPGATVVSFPNRIVTPV